MAFHSSQLSPHTTYTAQSIVAYIRGEKCKRDMEIEGLNWDSHTSLSETTPVHDDVIDKK